MGNVGQQLKDQSGRGDAQPTGLLPHGSAQQTAQGAAQKVTEHEDCVGAVTDVFAEILHPGLVRDLTELIADIQQDNTQDQQDNELTAGHQQQKGQGFQQQTDQDQMPVRKAVRQPTDERRGQGAKEAKDSQ